MWGVFYGLCLPTISLHVEKQDRKMKSPERIGPAFLKHMPTFACIRYKQIGICLNGAWGIHSLHFFFAQVTWCKWLVQKHGRFVAQPGIEPTSPDSQLETRLLKFMWQVRLPRFYVRAIHNVATFQCSIYFLIWSHSIKVSNWIWSHPA